MVGLLLTKRSRYRVNTGGWWGVSASVFKLYCVCLTVCVMVEPSVSVAGSIANCSVLCCLEFVYVSQL